MSQRLKEEFLELLEKDKEFRYAVAGLVGLEEILKRLDKHEAELVKLREDMLASFKRHDEEIAKLREDMIAGFKRHDEEMAKLREDMLTGFKRHDDEIAKLREDMVAGFKRYDEAIVKLREDMLSGFKRYDEEIAKLREDMNRGFRRVDVSLSQLWTTVGRLTLTVEEEALDVVGYRLRNELAVDIKLERIFVDGGEINLYGAAGDLCVVGEATVRLGVRLIDELEEKIAFLRSRRPDLLRRRIIKVVYADYAPPSAFEEAKRRGVWILKWSGDLTPRKILELE